MRIAAASALAALTFAAPAAAGPRAIVVAGPTLPRPVVIDDRAGLQTLYRALETADRTVAADALRGRPLLTLALTWPEGVRRPAAGRFWPAEGDHPAAVALAGRPPAQAPSDLLRVLYARGVPTRLDGGTWGYPALLFALVALGSLLTVVVAAWRVARLPAAVAGRERSC